MGKEKIYISNCPTCGIEKHGRKRDATIEDIEAVLNYMKS